MFCFYIERPESLFTTENKARNWPKKTPQKCLSNLCLQLWEAESDITRVRSEHSVKRTFCGFV